MDSLPSIAHPGGLPSLDPEAARHTEAVAHAIRQAIQASPDGAIGFDQWMDRALYAPGLGYYATGTTKFGASMPTGDFTTAPEMTPVFGQVLARQVAQILQSSDASTVLEFGAGSGALADAVLPALHDAGVSVRYLILEVSPDLRARQQHRLQRFGDDVEWLDQLPENFTGCVLANEVLDAMPVTLVQRDANNQLFELGVTVRDGAFAWTRRALPSALQTIAETRVPSIPGYRTEINRRAEAWVRQMGDWLTRGAALLIDYGFPQREFYHEQREYGTLMCHFRHHAHDQPLILPGLQDITAHVDFTAMADAALDGQLEVLGYTSQARFLLNAGLPDVMAQALPDPRNLSAIQKLLSEAEMGELFKVLAVGKGLDIDGPLLGFATGDRRHRL